MVTSQIGIVNRRRISLVLLESLLLSGKMTDKLVIVVVAAGRWARFSREFPG